MKRAFALGTLALALGCAATPEPPTVATGPALEWGIAIHGGAGKIGRDIDEDQRSGYVASLEAALDHGRRRLDGGARAVDVVEEVVRLLEDDGNFNAGRGAVFTRDGGHALDASIMDGRDRACGAVAGVTTVRHPVTLARRVMERSPYVLLGGRGAEQFADVEAVERVDPTWFDTERRRQSLREYLEGRDDGEPRGTVGVVARDRAGDLAAGTSTGGLTGKRWGRIGDSPIVGAGTWASNGTCAVSATGTGEQFIRHAVGRTIAALVEFGGMDCAGAAARVVEATLAPGDGGVIVVDAEGRASFAFNTAGMLRGAADSSGRFETAIWE